MVSRDWLVGDRRTAAAEKIYAAATELMARRGYEGLDVDVLAARVHCSRATVYRHVGGKRQIRDVVVARAAQRIVTRVRAEVDGVSGRERVVSAILLGLEYTRTDPLGRLVTAALRGADQMGWVTETHVFADLGAELVGVPGDRQAGQWIVRVILALTCWPFEDGRVEREVVERFVGPAFQGPSRADAPRRG